MSLFDAVFAGAVARIRARFSLWRLNRHYTRDDDPEIGAFEFTPPQTTGFISLGGTLTDCTAVGFDVDFDTEDTIQSGNRETSKGEHKPKETTS